VLEIQAAGDSGSDTYDECGCGTDPEHYGYVISEGQCCSIGMKTGCSDEGSPCLGCGVEMSQCTGGGDTGSDTSEDTGEPECSGAVGIDSYGMEDGQCCSMVRCSDGRVVGAACGAYDISQCSGGGDTGSDTSGDTG
jgi:hypothetical protein